MRLLLLFYFLLGFVFSNSIAGYYLLPKNEMGIESVVRVFEYKQKYYAYGFASKNNKSAGMDIKNPDISLRNREIRGMLFVWDLEKDKDSDRFINGKIYNYVNGKTYYLKAENKDNMLILKASVDSRGLFGKTLEWKKMTAEEASEFVSKDIFFDDVQSYLSNETKQ